MYKFWVNGKEISTENKKNLLKFLREDLHLTSVKNGCSEGACGTCMIILDGNAMKACVLTTEKIDGKNIMTMEGLSSRERDVFAYAFSEMGAVQCGFCIPGMVISGKALIDKIPDPTPGDIKKALRGNICRCTGYVKIEKAILLAAKLLREKAEVPRVECKGLVGDKVHRVDAAHKTLGIAEYTDDMRLEGMVYGSAIRPPYARAKFIDIDISEAAKHPDTVGILTADDIPGERFIGHLKKDWPVLIAPGEETRYVGDAVALVVSRTQESLDVIKSLIEIEWQELTPLSTVEEAMDEDAPHLHLNGNILFKQVLKRGEDVEEVIKRSKYVFSEKYYTPPTEHAFLEPECAVAHPWEDGVLMYTGGQSVYDEQHECADMLGLPHEKVRVISKMVGGGFGGKEDMSVQHHAALIAYCLQRPVKVLLTRKESLLIHPKRHAAWMEYTTACDEHGKLTALKAKIVTDTGAYASLGGPVLQRACTHGAGPYNYQNIDIEGTAVYTNNPPAGAFRGFGVTQSAFAIESNLNKLADMVGISPWEIRYRNAIEPGQILPNGQMADEGTALKETLLAVKEDFEEHPYAGISCAFKNSGIGVGIPDTGRVILEVRDGKVRIRTSAACIGQGMGTIALQMVCHTAGIGPDQVIVEAPDTHRTPNSGTTTASRQTTITGEAIKVAALKLRQSLLNRNLADLEGKEFEGEYVAVTDKMGIDKEYPVSHVAYGYATQVVVLDGDGKVMKVIAAHDVGTAINPNNVEGQIEGGVTMGLGYALTEDYPLENSIPKVKFGTLGLLRSVQVPEIVSKIIEKNDTDLAYGAKGVGEIVVIPTAPAVQGAYYRLDGRFRTKLPLEKTYYRR